MRFNQKRFEKRLSDCGIDLGIYNRAMAFFLSRHILFGYAPEKDMFFVSAIIQVKGTKTAMRHALYVSDVTEITDKPSHWEKALHDSAMKAIGQ